MDGHYEEEEVAAAAAAVKVMSGEEETEEGDDDSDNNESGSNNSSDDDGDDDDFSSYDLTDRDQVLLAVRDECTDDEEYGLLMKFCRKHLRSTYSVRRWVRTLWKETDYKLSFIDGIILVLLYARIGLDLNARYDDFCWQNLMDCCETDKDGRIVRLIMNPNRIYIDMEAEDYEEYNLPRVVVLLQNLKHLEVVGCQSFHGGDYLSLLPHLEEINMNYNRIHLSQSGLPVGTKPLLKVKKMSLYGCEWSGPANLPESDFFRWMKSAFPNLKAINCTNDINIEDETVVDALRHKDGNFTFVDALLHNDVCFQDKLESLDLEYCCISPNAETILNSGALSKFKNLQRINLSSNGIRNFNSIAVTSTTPLLPRTLHSVDLSDNPIMRTPSNQMTLLKFLETNSGIYSLGVGWFEFFTGDYHPDIKHVLLINCARRSFVDRNSTVLPSLLPKFLEQVYNKSYDIYVKDENLRFRGKKDSTGVYHLLRQNLPAVISSRLYPSSTGVKRKPEQRRLSKRKVRK